METTCKGCGANPSCYICEAFFLWNDDSMRTLKRNTTVCIPQPRTRSRYLVFLAMFPDMTETSPGELATTSRFSLLSSNRISRFVFVWSWGRFLMCVRAST